MCCTGAQWKREEVPDHKWDFIDVREFHSSGCMSYLQYGFLYLLVIKSVVVYCADIYTMVLMLASNYWAGSILQNSAGSSAVEIPFSIGKWIFFGCIVFSFLLLAWEARKSRAIIRSRDISYSYTNVMANNYYSLKSYNHFCFFSQINNSKKKKDDFAFFVFFTFKGWKRLLLADAPRQVINGLTLYSFAASVNFTTDISKWYDGSFAKATVLLSTTFTVTIWIGSFILLLVAAIMYVPLLCYIQGNLKEYCCHKVDKRIAELMKRKTRKRLAKEAALMKKEAMGDFSHLKDKKGQFKARPLPQPTLPTVGMIDLDDGKSDIGGSVVGGRNAVGVGARYPPQGGYAGSAVGYQPSGLWYGGEKDYGSEKGYAESIASTDHFIANQAPIAGYNNGYPTNYAAQPPQPYYAAPSNVNPQMSLNREPSYTSNGNDRYYDEADRKYAAAPYVGGRGSGPGSEYGGYAGSEHAGHDYGAQAHGGQGGGYAGSQVGGHGGSHGESRDWEGGDVGGYYGDLRTEAGYGGQHRQQQSGGGGGYGGR